MSPRAASRWVLLSAAILFAWNLWGYDLWAPDEPYFAEGAREMVVDGRWAVPHVNGAVTTDKPPLFFWLIALLSLPAGQVTSLTARLPSVLAALGTVALSMRLAGRLYGARAAPLAGLLVATNYLVWDKARSSQIDSLLCFLILVALSAFEAFRAGDADGRRAGLLFWLAALLAVLAKGPVGVLLPVGIVVATLALERDLRAWGRFAPLSGPALFVALASAWIAFATIGGDGNYSVWGAFREHVLDRAVRGMHHRQPPWYYLEMLPVQLLPWSGLVPGALVLAWRSRGKGDRLLLAWALLVVAFFSLSTEKRDLYVLPAYPAFLILAAAHVEARAAGTLLLDPRWFVLPQAFFAGTVALAGGLLPFLNAREGLLSAPVAAILGVALAATGGASAWAAWRGRTTASVMRLAAGTAAVYLVMATLVFPAVNQVKSARAFAEALRERTAASRAAGREVVAYRTSNLPEAIAFYSDGVYLRETSDPAVLAAHLSRPDRVFAVVSAADLGDLPPSSRERITVVESSRFSRMQALLISNGADEGER